MFLFLISDYDALFIIRDGSVGLPLLIPSYGYLTFTICFGWFWYVVRTVFIVLFYLCFLTYVKAQLTHNLSCLFLYCSFAIIGHADTMYSTVSSECLQSLHFLSVSVCNIFVAWYLIRNASSCTAIVSLSVSSLRSPLDSHRNCLLP